MWAGGINKIHGDEVCSYLLSHILTEYISQCTECFFFFLSLLPPSSIPKIPWVCEYFSFSLLFSHSGLQVYPAHLQEQELSVTKGCQSSHVKEETWFGASFSASLITKHLWAREFKRLCLHHLWIFLPAVALISLPAQPGTIPQHPKLKKKKKKSFCLQWKQCGWRRQGTGRKQHQELKA